MLRSTVIFSKGLAGVVSRLTKKASIAGTAVHGLALEVRRQRPLAIRAVLQRLIPVGTERSWQHGDITEDALRQN